MGLTEETVLGDLTFKKNQQGITQTQLDVLKLATNAANAIYNLDLPSSGVRQGYELDAQPDLRLKGAGTTQSYDSDPGYILGPTQVDTANGLKSGVFVNEQTNTVLITFAGMDGFSDNKDQGSAVIWNGKNQFDSYKGEGNPQSLRNQILALIDEGRINANTKIIFAGQSLGTALVTMATADFANNILPGLIQSNPDWKPQNVVLLGENGLGVTDALLAQTAGMTNEQLAASGVSRMYVATGDVMNTGTGDLVNALVGYALGDGDGVLQLNRISGEPGVRAYHSIQTSIYPGLEDLIANPESAIIRDHRTFDANTAIAVARFIGTLGSDGSTLAPGEGYLRVALGGLTATALASPGEAGQLFGKVLGQTINAPDLGNILGYLVEFGVKYLFLTNPVAFAVGVLKGLGLVEVLSWFGGNAEQNARMAEIQSDIGVTPDGATRTFVSLTPDEYIVIDGATGADVFIDTQGNRTIYADDGSVVRDLANHIIAERTPDGSGVIRVQDKTFALNPAQTLSINAAGELVATQADNDSHVFSIVYHEDASITRIESTLDPTTGEVASISLVSTFSGMQVSATFDVHDDGTTSVKAIDSINGQTPSDIEAAVAALNAFGASPEMLFDQAGFERLLPLLEAFDGNVNLPVADNSLLFINTNTTPPPS